jgi:ParB family chromosome partitioning protein
MSAERGIVYLNPRDLLPARQSVRSDPGDLAGLAETIREHGLLQPLGVIKEQEGYRVVYGNRRRDAAIVVGLDRVPCLVLDAADEQGLIIQQVLENLQRLDLNDLDKSRAFEQLLSHMTEQGLSQGEALDAMARTLGLSARQIQRYLRLRQLAPEVQRLIAQGELGVTHGQHLAEITPPSRQEALALLAVEESLSAAELARLCAALQHNANIEPQVALSMLRRGERIAVVEGRPPEEITPFAPPPSAPEEKLAEAEEELIEEEPEEAEAPGQRFGPPAGGSAEEYGAFEPVTRDGNRVRKFHSLDAFMDELQRLTQCIQEGTLQKLLEADEASAVKIRLAARQAGYLAEALAALAQAMGPTAKD